MTLCNFGPREKTAQASLHGCGAGCCSCIPHRENQDDVTMTMEDLERTVATAVTAAMAARSGSEKTKKSLDEKHFRRVDKFSSVTGWKEFAFQLRTAMETADEAVREILDEITKAAKDLDWLHLLASLADAEEKKLGADL